jgi:hypothetical protein
MRREDGRVCGSGDFFLGKGSRHDFGPSTIQLKDNWRMVSVYDNSLRFLSLQRISACLIKVDILCFF